MIEYENLRLVNEPFHEGYEQCLRDMLARGWYILGEQVDQFEKDFARYHQIPYCVGVASGLDALQIALRCGDFPPGSEVILPAHTFIATVLAVLRLRLKPVLVEPDLHTYNIDPNQIEAAITPRTVAILIVHMYGKCCGMDKIMSLAQRYHLKVLEDCAQAHGASLHQRKAGTFGDWGAFSFYPTKNLGALGDGGGILTADQSHDTRLRVLRNYGSPRKYVNEEVGYNSRLDELQAAFLGVKLKKLDDINQHKRALARLYLDYLKEDFIKPTEEEGYFDVYHIFTIRHPQRDQLRDYLLRQGIKTEIHYPVPPHQQPACAQQWADKAFPITEEISQTTLSLPISYGHTPQQIEKVIEVLNRF